MILNMLRRFWFGKIESSHDAITQDARRAHHDLRNTALTIKRVSRELDREANNLLALLARDAFFRDNGPC